MKNNKNIIRLTESDLKYIISETAKRILKEDIAYPTISKMFHNPEDDYSDDDYDYDDEDYDEEVDNEPMDFTIGVLCYDLNGGEIKNYEDGYNQDHMDTYPEALEVLKHMITYPENSEEWDLRYANNMIPILYVLRNNNPVGDFMFISSKEEKYYKYVNEALAKYLGKYPRLILTNGKDF
jgi:hypothetical protein